MLEHYQRIVLKSIGLDFFAARSGAPRSTLGAGSPLAAVRAAARVVAHRGLSARGRPRGARRLWQPVATLVATPAANLYVVFQRENSSRGMDRSF